MEKKNCYPKYASSLQLKECAIACGSVHAFWCLRFERFNGILGSMQVNGRSVEVQLMRKPLAGWFVWDVSFPGDFQDNFMPFLNKEGTSCGENFSLKTATQLFNSACCWHLKDFQWSDLALVRLPSKYKVFKH